MDRGPQSNEGLSSQVDDIVKLMSIYAVQASEEDKTKVLNKLENKINAVIQKFNNKEFLSNQKSVAELKRIISHYKVLNDGTPGEDSTSYAVKSIRLSKLQNSIDEIKQIASPNYSNSVPTSQSFNPTQGMKGATMLGIGLAVGLGVMLILSGVGLALLPAIGIAVAAGLLGFGLIFGASLASRTPDRSHPDVPPTFEQNANEMTDDSSEQNKVEPSTSAAYLITKIKDIKNAKTPTDEPTDEVSPKPNTKDNPKP